MNRSFSLYIGFILFLTSEISATGSAIIIRSAQQYEKIVSSKKPLVTLYSASWCGPCKIVKPLIIQAAHKFPDITFCIIDVDAKPLQKLCATVKTIPKLTFSHHGAIVSEHLGALSSVDLTKKCSELRERTRPSLKK